MPPEKFSITTPSTLAINATNAPFHRQTRLGKDSYHQRIQSLHHQSIIDVLCSIFIFHSEKAQPTMKGLNLKKLSQSRGIILGGGGTLVLFVVRGRAIF